MCLLVYNSPISIFKVRGFSSADKATKNYTDQSVLLTSCFTVRIPIAMALDSY